MRPAPARPLEILLLVFLCAAPLLAQDHPNEARGFAPDKAFHMSDFDTVNAFNGNLIVTLPIGPAYPVKADLSYGLTLVYNSKVWDISSAYQGSAAVDATRVSNTGMGWRLSMGRFWTGCVANEPCDTTYPGVPAYESPDGAVHDFYSTLHPDDAKPAGDTSWYTRDGSYLRLKPVGTEWEIEEPGGLIRRFEPDPTTAATNDMRAKSVRDRWNNTITVAYGTGWWSVSDPNGRTQTIHTKSMQVPGSELPADGHAVASIPANLATVIDYVDVVAPQSKTLRYLFGYQVKETARGCSLYSLPANDLHTIFIPYLTSVTLYDATALTTPLQQYGFTNNVTADYSTVCGTSANVGTLASMSMPTGGVVSWTYDIYVAAEGACSDSGKSFIVGVKTRTLADGVSATNPQWTYSPALVDASGGESTVVCSIGQTVHPQQKDLVVTVTAPTGEAAKNYFTVWNESSTAVSANGTRKDDYGLPYVRSGSVTAQVGANTVTRYLSRSALKTNGTPARSTYLSYERDASTASSKACNRRVSGSRDVFDDDSGHYIDTAKSNFDGLGHYRSETQTGDFVAGDSRTTFADFNAAIAEYKVVNGVASAWNGPPSTWLLNLFTKRTVTENGNTAAVKYDFDSTTGTLNYTRSLVHDDGTTDPHDVVALLCRDSAGNVIAERNFGGDGSAVPSSVTCSATPEYQINHSYATSGPRNRSWVSGLTNPFNLLDQTLDTTGSPTSTRDAAGVETTNERDILGRITKVTPTGVAWSEYIYKLPGETYNQATITLPTLFENLRGVGTTAAATPLMQRKYEFDKLGRLIRQSQLGPDGNWSAFEIAYDASGRKHSVSEPESTGTSAPSAALVAALKTVYTYDEFGRPTQVQAPDTTTTTFEYHGTRESKRHVTIASGGSTTISSTTTYDYDSFGRLRVVTEPSGPSSSTSPAAADVATQYSYDVGGHLSSVVMTGPEGIPQNRIFDYDRRGFLQWEVHPESGMTAYTHDSRGNVLTKRQAAAGTAFDLNYEYDAAGRLRFVRGRNPSFNPSSPDMYQQTEFRPVKEFQYIDLNDLSSTPHNLRAGKLSTAVRYNYPTAGIPSTNDIFSSIVRVSETYVYGDAAGRKTHRTTTIDTWNPAAPGPWFNYQTVEQNETLDDLGLPAEVSYPLCLNCGVPPYAPERNVTPANLRGQVTAVPDFVSSISYWPNGMRKQLLHANNVADLQSVDGLTADAKASLPRPASISSGLYDACATPVITAQPQGGQITTSTPSITLQIAVTAYSTVQYQWYARPSNASQFTAMSGATASSYSASPSSTTSYYVAITNSCRTLNSRTATVTVGGCSNPAVSSISATVSEDRMVTLSAAANGTEPYSFTWYRSSDNVVVGTGPTVTIGPISATTSYYAKVTNTCSSVVGTSNTVVASIPLPMPSTGLVATKTGSTQITITWPAVSGAGRYHLERRSHSDWVDLTASSVYTGTSYVDTGALLANHTYAYRVWASDSADNSRSAYSNVDVATLMTFTGITGGVTPVTSAIMDELRTAVNNVRDAAGWSAVTWTDILGPGQPLPAPQAGIRSAHLLALRGRMNEALQALGVSVSGYTDPDPSLKRILAVHITQIQGRAQ